MARHVFISHSHEDAPRANALVEALEQRGVRCWIAPRDVTPGGSYAESILTGLEGSSCFVLIYSSASNKSRHVLREVERALVLGVNIVPVRFDDAPVSKSLDYLLATVHWISVASNDPGLIAGVAERIRACAAAADAPTAGAATPATTPAPMYQQAPIVPPAPAPTRSGPGRGLLFAGCAVLLLLIIVGGGAAFFLMQRTTSAPKTAETPPTATPPPQVAPSAAAPVVAEAPAAPASQPPVASLTPAAAARWLIADSSTRLLSIAELQQLSRDELWRARNEIYARRGLIFSSERGRQFAAQLGPEYRGTETSEEAVTERLSPTEKKNVGLIKALEAGNVRLGTVRDPDGYTNVRAKPSTQSTIVARVSDGEAVQLHGKNEGWYAVTSLGPPFEGYIHESRIQQAR